MMHLGCCIPSSCGHLLPNSLAFEGPGNYPLCDMVQAGEKKRIESGTSHPLSYPIFNSPAQFRIITKVIRQT